MSVASRLRGALWALAGARVLPLADPKQHIVAIRVLRMWESCQRTTFYVELLTDEGFTMTPASHRTGSVYTNFEGLSEDEARQRALIDADTWGDFLGIVPEPFTQDGVTYVPDMTMRPYETRRVLAERRKAKAASANSSED